LCKKKKPTAKQQSVKDLLFSVSNSFLFSFAAAAFFSFFFAAADGLAITFGVETIVTAIAVVTTFKCNAEILLEDSISNSNKCPDAYYRTNDDKQYL